MRKGFIPEFESSLMSGGVSPGPFILYGPGLSKDPRFANHEPGHVLQYWLMGPVTYYTLVAVPSLLTANLPNAMEMPWEKSASYLWYWFTGEKEPELK